MLLIDRVRAANGKAIVMGDLNAGEDNRAVRLLIEGGLVDSYRGSEQAKGTFTGFDPKATEGPKIDYIFTSGQWDVLESGIDRTAFDGRLPSDHFPVWARVTIGA